MCVNILRNSIQSTVYSFISTYLNKFFMYLFAIIRRLYFIMPFDHCKMKKMKKQKTLHEWMVGEWRAKQQATHF